MERLPEDKVPYWDFDDPGIPDAPRDASAAAVVASALLELSTYLPNGKGKYYKDAAIEMLSSLSSRHYQSGKSKPSFLLHSVGPVSYTHLDVYKRQVPNPSKGNSCRADLVLTSNGSYKDKVYLNVGVYPYLAIKMIRPYGAGKLQGNIKLDTQYGA